MHGNKDVNMHGNKDVNMHGNKDVNMHGNKDVNMHGNKDVNMHGNKELCSSRCLTATHVNPVTGIVFVCVNIMFTFTTQNRTIDPLWQYVGNRPSSD